MSKPEFEQHYDEFNEERLADLENMTKVPALELLKQAQLLPTPPPNTILFDSAAGAGCLTATFLKALQKEGKRVDALTSEGLKIVCADIEPTLVASASARVKAHGWDKVVDVQNVDSMKTSFPDNHFTHVLVNVGPQAVADPTALCRETLRILRPSGIAGFTSGVGVPWYASVKAVFPAFELPPVLTELWTKPDVVTKDLTELGYKDIKIKPFAFTETSNVDTFVDGLSSFIPYLKEPAQKEAYATYLREHGDGRVVVLNSNVLIVTARK